MGDLTGCFLLFLIEKKPVQEAAKKNRISADKTVSVMRYIAIDKLRPEPAWLRAAADALQAVRSAVSEQRSTAIKDHDHVWGLFKDALRELSYNKCWYCESIDARSDNAVDHYRPKGNVKGATPPHQGYWWLAFDWKNYRFSCTYCNSIRKSAETTGGKQDYFPLFDETARARTDSDSIDDEFRCCWIRPR